MTNEDLDALERQALLSEECLPEHTAHYALAVGCKALIQERRALTSPRQMPEYDAWVMPVVFSRVDLAENRTQAERDVLCRRLGNNVEAAASAYMQQVDPL